MHTFVSSFFVKCLISALKSLKTDKVYFHFTFQKTFLAHNNIINYTYINFQPTFNNGPLVNERRTSENGTGFFLSSGKGSHSTIKVPGTTFVKMAPNSAVRNGQTFVLIKILTWNQHCTRGNFFVNLKRIEADALNFLPEFLYFNGNMRVYNYWEMASKTIAPLLQTIPRNIHPSCKPSACKQKAYTDLLNSSNLNYCTCNNDDCEVNAIISEFLKVF